MMSQLFTAFNSYGRALHFLPKQGIRNYLLYPILINILVIVFMLWAGISYGSWLAEYAIGLVDLPQNDWTSALSILLTILVYALTFLLYISVYKYLVLIILSPFLAFLSEKTEKEENHNDYPFTWAQLWNDVLRAIVINFRNFLFEIIATILLSFLAFIPLIGFLTPIAILVVQSYFFGFALMDYNAERHRMSRRQTEQWMRAHFWAVTGTGMVFHFVFLIPIVGWIVAPVWGTVAGTLSFLNIYRGTSSSSSEVRSDSTARADIPHG